MSNLKRFSDAEILLSQDDAFKTLVFFSPSDIGSLTAESLTKNHIMFAQAILVEAIDASYAMGYAEALFKSFLGKTPMSFASVARLVASFCGRAAKNWFSNEVRRNAGKLPSVQIYYTVRNTIVLKHRITFLEIREGIFENY